MAINEPDDYYPNVDAIYEERHLSLAYLEELNSSRHEDSYGPYDGGYDDFPFDDDDGD